MEDRINYFERMLAENPDNPTGLLALANEYQKVGRDEDEAAVLERYVSVHDDDEGNALHAVDEGKRDRNGDDRRDQHRDFETSHPPGNFGRGRCLLPRHAPARSTALATAAPTT